MQLDLFAPRTLRVPVPRAARYVAYRLASEMGWAWRLNVMSVPLEAVEWLLWELRRICRQSGRDVWVLSGAIRAALVEASEPDSDAAVAAMRAELDKAGKARIPISEDRDER